MNRLVFLASPDLPVLLTAAEPRTQTRFSNFSPRRFETNTHAAPTVSRRASCSEVRLLVHAHGYRMHAIDFPFSRVVSQAFDLIGCSKLEAAYGAYYFVDEGSRTFFEVRQMYKQDPGVRPAD